MKKVFKIILAIVIVGAIFLTLYGLWLKSQPKLVTYEIEKVEKGDIQKVSVATGKVSPRDEVEIKPQISGIIATVLKEAGEFVKVGDVIATVTVVPEMSQLNSAESRVNVAEIVLKKIKADYDRQKQLFNKGVIAKAEMDESEVEYRKALEEFDNAKDNLDIVRTGMSKKTAKYSNTQIRSTITGMVLDVPVKVGNSVILSNTFNDGTTIATVADMNDMLFIGNLDETEVGKVKNGMPMKLIIGALNEQYFPATLEYIAPKGKEENGAILFEIKAAAQIPDSVVIRAGYSANAEIVLEKVQDVLVLPENTVEFKNDSSFVYVLKDSLSMPQVFDRKSIEIGLSDGVRVEVKAGLNAGDKVRGNEKLDGGKK